MSATKLADVSAQIKEFWSDLFVDELKESSLAVNLFSRDYAGEIKQGGNVVKVSQLVRPTGSTKTIGQTGYDVYDTEKLVMQQIQIKADKIFEAGLEVESIVDLQSQIGQQDSKIRTAMREAIEIQINNFVYSLFSCSNKAGTVTDFNASQISALRKYAGQKKWRKDGQWYLLADCSYHTDLLNSQTLVNADYSGGEAPMIAGQIVKRRFGFNIIEDNSDGLLSLINKCGGSAAEDMALAAHRDAIHLVLQGDVDFKLSDLHASKKRGYLLTAEIIGGGAQGHDHNDLHKAVYNA